MYSHCVELGGSPAGLNCEVGRAPAQFHTVTDIMALENKRELGL